MLLAWMAYSVLFGALVYGAALAGERAAAIAGRSSRFVWVAAIVVAAIVPALFATRPRVTTAVDNAPTDALAAPDVIVSFGRGPAAPAEPLAVRARRVLASSDPLVLALWAFASLGCLALIGRAAVGIRRRRARWHAIDLDGVRVLVAPDVGPAVVGAFAPRIVIPRWALALDESARALMLRHEAEHIRARDPLVLFAATAATALMPWNPALWLVARRLRLAIEIDCDRRVLRSSARAREYGELLLAVGARLSAPLPFAASLAERRPFLERRIRAMTALSPRHPRLVASGCIALVVVASTAAVRAPRPTSLVSRHAAPTAPRLEASSATATPDSRLESTSATVPPAAITPSRSSSADAVVSLGEGPRVAPLVPVGPVRNPDSLTVAEIRELIEAHHPTVISGDPSINTITLVVDSRGNYVVSTAEARSMMVAAGRGGRGRGGSGAGAAIAPGGGDVGYARGRVGGGGRGVAASASGGDSVLYQQMRQRVEEATAKLQRAASDTGYARQSEELAARAKIAREMTATGELRATAAARITGDSVIRQENVYVLDGFVRRQGGDDKPLTREQAIEAGTKIGLNMSALANLIEPESIESVQIHTFLAGQLGPGMLRVFVIHQR
jgi:beta-lactamase regulating signal transducer with metallopeptidase domain